MGKGVKEVQGRIEELEEELEAERQSRSKAERQRSDLAREIEELGHRLDEAGGATNAQVELNKKRENEIAKLRKDMEEASMSLGDFENNKRKVVADNADLLRVVGELSTSLNLLTNAKGALAAQLDEAKSRADSESRERTLLLGKFRNLEHEADGAREALEEIANERENLMRQVAKAETDAAMWRQKYETEAVAKAEELEMTKMKLMARLTEAESMI